MSGNTTLATPRNGLATAHLDPSEPMPRLNAFMILGNCKPGKAREVREMAAARAGAGSWEQIYAMLKPLTIHYARWALINNDAQLLYAAVFDTDFDTYAEDAHHIFLVSGFPNFFEVMEGFPDDWKTNLPAFIRFFKERHQESIYEFASYPGVTVAEIERGLRLRQSFSDMLDQMQ